MKTLRPYLYLGLLFVIPVIIAFFVTNSFTLKETDDQKPGFAIAIHGGAGTITKEGLSKEAEEMYETSLKNALNIGIDILENKGTSLDAVEKVINYLENDSLFNAGKGAVLTHDKKAELDASIMEGKTLNAGAVAGVTTIKNPISAARKVMENSPHVLLSNEGANKFAVEQELETVENNYFYTVKSINRIEKVLEKEKSIKKHGTVGCVALDMAGNLAAGTSTGGMTNKMFGRIGDSPIIGAGTYANNNTCAVSCTGHGEYFIRYAVAYDVSALMEYKSLSLNEAVSYIIHDKLKNAGGTGGLIAIDKYGNISMQFNTDGMFRASYTENGERIIKMFIEED